MPLIQRFRESWLRPALFFGNNPISLAGGAITTASGVTMISYWVAETRSAVPTTTLISASSSSSFCPGLFMLGLALIPVGIFLRRREAANRPGRFPPNFPRSISTIRIFRHGIDIVLVATIVNFLVVATASYRGAAYMDSPQFCGQSCHVMQPEYTAYKISAHSHVACVECHIGSGAEAYFSAKVNGTKQLIEVTPASASRLSRPKSFPTIPRRFLRR